MTDDEQPATRPRRDTSRFEREQAARLVVKATAVTLDAWQSEVAVLRGLSRSSHLDRAKRSGARRTCRRLISDVHHAEARLLADTPAELRTHSRVVDIQRALRALKVSIESILRDLDTKAEI